MELYEIAEHFHRIFNGNNRAHGEYIIKQQKGPKATGQAKTVSTPATIDLWEKHLKGEIGLGIVPITENSSCTWGAVDIDVYDGLDLEDLSFKLPEPLILCRSKSGGAHIFLFTQTPTSAALLRKKLTIVSRAVGHPNAEIFPKQDTLNPGDIGNWINIPYFNHTATMRYSIKGGISLTAEEFITHVSENAITQQQLVSFQMESILEPHEDPEFNDAPPCLRYFVTHGFPPGTRNSALFSMGVFARKKFMDGWQDKVAEYNLRFMGPGTYSEVAGVIRSLNKKSYYYKCKDQPLISQCDKDACALCTYGVQPSHSEEKSSRPCVLDTVLSVTCYNQPIGSKDEPYWVLEFESGELDITLEMFSNQRLFLKEYFRVFKRLMLSVKDKKWTDKVNELQESAEQKELAPDAGPEGQLWVHLEEYCTSKAKAKTRDELILGKPWQDGERTYFTSKDLMKYLSQQRFNIMKEKEIWPILRRHGATHHAFNLKGKHLTCWSVTSFDEQDEDFSREPMDDENSY